MKLPTLKSLAVKHEYYAATSNYCDIQMRSTFPDWESFYAEWSNADYDYNVIFRWDIFKYAKNDEQKRAGYFMEVFYIQQRKGIYYPVIIESLKEINVEDIVMFLRSHYNYLNKLWEPVNNK